MSCNHVCKKTYDQCHRLDKYAKKFYRNKNEFYTHRHTRRIEYMSPIMFFRTDKYNNKGDKTKNKCEGKVSGHICRARYQSNKIVDKNKKENSESVRKIFLPFIAKVWFCYFITDKSNYRLKQVLHSCRSSLNTMALLI